MCKSRGWHAIAANGFLPFLLSTSNRMQTCTKSEGEGNMDADVYASPQSQKGAL